jgi:hypothetical protein
MDFCLLGIASKQGGAAETKTSDKTVQITLQVNGDIVTGWANNLYCSIRNSPGSLLTAVQPMLTKSNPKTRIAEE